MATAENTQKAADAHQDTGNPRKRKIMLVLLAIVVILAGAGVWAYHELYGRWNESTDDAYVNGNVVEI
ncbi:EmrA/EmrK family multidrug efflux transporter periplasmic adaptor subunit, partial [Pseudomonas sp. TH10]|nr:EmrA/EmrK family multidrug efflux transporter periplasmic adaptor subunit [Pseudomonas sp. TH10]